MIVVIPVKNPFFSKSRLSGALTQWERHSLAKMMLKDILDVLIATKEVKQILVTSPSFKILSIAEKWGCLPYLDQSKSLNDALFHASNYSKELGESSILIIPGDVPLLTSKDVSKLYHSLKNDKEVTIVPTKDGGTGAILMRPPGVIPSLFGKGSFWKHCFAAMDLCIEVSVLFIENIMIDLDCPEDISFYTSSKSNNRTTRFLKRKFPDSSFDSLSNLVKKG